MSNRQLGPMLASIRLDDDAMRKSHDRRWRGAVTPNSDVKILRLDRLGAVSIHGSKWIPIRSTLGVRAFGINAYAPEQAGDVVFNEHDETENLAGTQRHEELYVVLRGRARFTVDGADVDAPAGTLVFVDDPASRRAAVAEEDGTLVLAIGGPVGEPYSPPPWEEMFLEEIVRRPET